MRSVLRLVCAAQFMVVLDVSVVNVALPSMQDALGFGDGGLQWVVTAYTLVFGGFLMLGGRLADLYGRRQVFVAGLGVFTGASLVGGLAGGPGTLVAARAVQGLGAAVLAPATLTILTTTFAEGTRRTRALAVWTAVSVGGGAAGNLVGGLLTEYLSWRWVLLVNVPIGAVVMGMAGRLPEVRGQGGRRLDVPGAVAATGSVGLVLYGVSGPAWALVLGALLLAGFVVIERRAVQPLVPPRLVKARSVALGNAVMLLAGACFQVPLWYFLTLYMQRDLGYGPLETGLGFLPHTLGTIAVSLWVTPRLMKRVDHRTLIAVGALLAAVGFLWQSRMADAGYAAAILGPAVCISVGGGLFNTPLTSTVVSGVADGDAGAASGLMNTAKQLGGAAGLAVMLAAVGDGRGGFVLGAGLLAVVAGLAFALPARRD